ncbi:TetR/AcrR family transcriptional regulator [Sphingomonas crocodyli]|uniref:TetR/AcrR family transcriptional regulator n=1 Tax=Sphingomonas crocodyli TaxID=1979270 RepID=A0A437LUU3_9SPHN|nr:TetR/AcrR family transcriptional regulator [Sphingomonas crocodyli]RVT89146.1 TetR/AcrR family transcriptional regulator [Sphingomonas crocodyli]
MTVAVPLRSDAQANRERILEVARDALAADPATSLNAIAKLAAVGPGTLYRHFPTREALVVAVYRADLQGVVDLARELTEQLPPIEALRAWCRRVVELARRQTGFSQLLTAALTEQQRMEAHLPVHLAIAHLTNACIAAGMISTEIEPIDVQLALAFTWNIRTEEGERRAFKSIDILILGLTNY